MRQSVALLLSMVMGIPVCVLAGSLSPTVPTPRTMLAAPAQQGIPLPSRWSGYVTGQVHQSRFRLPITIECSQPLPGELNPANVFMAIGEESQVGQALLFSARQFTTPYTGRTATLQYLAVEIRGQQIRAQLIDDHAAEAAVMNGFTAGNLSAETAPPVMRDIYRSLGTTELFAFRRGARVVMERQGDRLFGALQGAGHSYTGIFPLPDIGYEGQFEAVRVR